jgi:hypothetical protein
MPSSLQGIKYELLDFILKSTNRHATDTMQESKLQEWLYTSISYQNKRRKTKTKHHADKKTNFEHVNQHPAKNCDEI